MRRFALVIASTLMLTVFVPVGSAQRPAFEPVPFEEFTLTGFCEFDVLVSPLQNELVRKVFVNQNGDVVKEVWTGVVKARFTNVSTGKTFDANISGPEQVRIVDGSVTDVAVGPWLIPSGSAGTILLTRGRYIFGSGPVLANLRGTTVDVCAALAGPQ